MGWTSSRANGRGRRRVLPDQALKRPLLKSTYQCRPRCRTVRLLGAWMSWEEDELARPC